MNRNFYLTLQEAEKTEAKALASDKDLLAKLSHS